MEVDITPEFLKRALNKYLECDYKYNENEENEEIFNILEEVSKLRENIIEYGNISSLLKSKFNDVFVMFKLKFIEQTELYNLVRYKANIDVDTNDIKCQLCHRHVNICNRNKHLESVGHIVKAIQYLAKDFK